MAKMQAYEQRRLILQSVLDAEKTQEERNAQGQFATPTSLARDVLAYAVSLLPKGEKLRFLDPGIGTGSFYSALRATVSAARISAAVGYEIDPHYSVPARNLWAKTKLNIQEEDFTRASAPQTEDSQFNLLICNPPYVRHHHIVNGEKSRLQDVAVKVSGV